MSTLNTTADLATTLTWLADEDLAVGHRLTSISGFGPELEINIALSSMGQDELGHARAYYILSVGADREAINSAIYDRSANEFGGALLAWVDTPEWERMVVKHVLYEMADDARRVALALCPQQDVAATVERMAGEECYHIDFWRTWFERTVKRGAAAAQLVQNALDELWPHASQLLDVPGIDALVPDGLADARRRWNADVEALVSSVGLQLRGDLADTAPLSDGRGSIVDDLQYVRRLTPGVW